MTILALDIGGANLKVADGRSYASSYTFPLWKFPQQLADRLEEIISVAPLSDRLVATMTGELADCYATKRDGVIAIVEALEKCSHGRQVGIYLTDGSIVGPSEGKERYRLAAASNWHP